MKKLLILLLSFSVLLACNNNKTSDKRGDRDTASTRDKDDRGRGDDDGRDAGDNDGKIDRNSGKYDDVVDDDEEGNHVPESNWSSTDVKIFVTSCVNTAVAEGMSRSVSESYCNCMQKKIERAYPNSAHVSRFDQNSAQAMEWAQECLGLKSSSKSSSNGWSRKDELDFVNSCVTEAESKGMESLDAQSYCDCMQYKLEKLYPDVSSLLNLDFTSPAMKRLVRECQEN
jgi:hypothetical protein